MNNISPLLTIPELPDSTHARKKCHGCGKRRKCKFDFPRIPLPRSSIALPPIYYSIFSMFLFSIFPITFPPNEDEEVTPKHVRLGLMRNIGRTNPRSCRLNSFTNHRCPSDLQLLLDLLQNNSQRCRISFTSFAHVFEVLIPSTCKICKHERASLPYAHTLTHENALHLHFQLDHQNYSKLSTSQCLH